MKCHEEEKRREGGREGEGKEREERKRKGGKKREGRRREVSKRSNSQKTEVKHSSIGLYDLDYSYTCTCAY